MSDVIELMIGHEYFYYQCSECKEPIVALRPHSGPLHCSDKCKRVAVNRELDGFGMTLDMDVEDS